MMSLYPLQEHWIVNSIFEGCAKEGQICACWKREEHAKVDWAGCEGPGARCDCWPLGRGSGDMAVPDFEKAIYANEEKSVWREVLLADGTFEGRRGGWMDEKSERTSPTVWSEKSVPSPGVEIQRRSSRIFTLPLLGRSTLL
jgi:hypothetical protein